MLVGNMSIEKMSIGNMNMGNTVIEKKSRQQKNIEEKIKQPIQTHFVRSSKGPFTKDFTNIL